MAEDRIENELARIRGLIALARETGVSELHIDRDTELSSVHLKLSTRSLFPNQEKAPIDPDERAALNDEEREAAAEESEEAAYYREWRRITRSSGAPIPPFKKREPRLPVKQ